MSARRNDFRQSVDRLFSHESIARIGPTISEVKGAYSDDSATELGLLHALWQRTYMAYIYNIRYPAGFRSIRIEIILLFGRI